MTSFQPNLLKSIILGFVALFLFNSNCFGQSKTEQLDNLLNTYLEYGKFNGSVLVSANGEVIYKKGFGMANMEWDIPNAPDTKHRLGSITKQFTAMLILQLAAEEKLDLQAPITTYLPDYNKVNGDKITTHHLLTHTSGIPNYTAFPGFFENESRNPSSPDEFVDKFEEMALEFEPGERWNYSNSGYFLLGVLIEKICGKSYEEMLHQNIFIPLGMKDTGYDHHDDILKKRATGYEKSGGEVVNSKYIDMSLPYAAGSMYSTVEDLFIWDQALYTNKLLPKEYMDMYFEPYSLAFGGAHYAYGWIIGKEQIGNTTDSIATIGHGGGINGFNTNISRSTSDNSVVILLNNTGGAPLNSITSAIRGILNGKSYDLPKKSLAYDLIDVIHKEGIEKGVSFYTANKDSKEYTLDEGEMNQIGYQLMAGNKVEEAAEVFKLNIEAFPLAFNVYDSYAEALMKLGQNEAAIENYKKSIELNPANQNGIEMLKKLGVDTGELEKEVVVSEEILDTYLGEYELTPGFTITITRDGSQLQAQATGQQRFDIFPKSEHVFYLKVITAQITFNANESGVVDSMTLLQAGQEMTGKRIK